MFVCYACIYVFDFLLQKSERLICKNYISVLRFMRMKYFGFHTITNYKGGPQDYCA
jgi:hypothetical protein